MDICIQIHEYKNTIYLSPLIPALRVHESHLNVVPSVFLVVAVPLQPPVNLDQNYVMCFCPCCPVETF